MESWIIYMLIAWLAIFAMMGWSINKLLKAERGEVS
ncbi:hypothetical protein GQS_04415 [Thermococcus sp. 4557]|jgi:hypothetical protein|nr:hypothetical protein GQS_04415 [Thermococcus sp. 4557]